MDKFTFFRSYMEAIEDLPAEEFKEIVMAICRYALDDEETELTGAAKVAYKLITPIIDNGKQLSETRAEAGKKGMKTRWGNNKAITNDNKGITNDNNGITSDNGIGIGEGIGKGKGVGIGKDKDNTRRTYGEYKHVKLTDKEYQKLCEDYGDIETGEAITYLDEYIEMKGAKYKNHNLALRKWVFDAVKEKKPKTNEVDEYLLSVINGGKL